MGGVFRGENELCFIGFVTGIAGAGLVWVLPGSPSRPGTRT